MSRRFAILAGAVASLLGAGTIPTVEAQVQGPEIWMSFRGNTTVPGVGTVTDEDIVIYDESTGLWSLGFDGSDVGLGSLEIDGLAILPDGDLLLSFTKSGTVGGLAVDDSDIVRFSPAALGANTAGTFGLYFDGSDVGLTEQDEDIDAIGLAAEGSLLISTQGDCSVTGATGADADIFSFTGTVGSATSGSFALFFDGSDVGLSSKREDVDAIGLTADGNLLFSTERKFSVIGLSGADEDLAEFGGAFGSTTAGSIWMRQDLTMLGISAAADIGSLHVVE